MKEAKAEVNIRSNYFYGTPQFRAAGTSFCPTTFMGRNPSGVPQLFLSSTKFNCLTLPSSYYCPNLIEYQRQAAECSAFCGANGGAGTCGGHGYCSNESGSYKCVCDSGYSLTSDGLSCQ